MNEIVRFFNKNMVFVKISNFLSYFGKGQVTVITNKKTENFNTVTRFIRNTYDLFHKVREKHQ